MPTGAKYEFPQGNPLFNTTWRAVSEANAGVGVLDTDDLEVTASSTDLELDVTEGDLWFPEDEQDYSYDGGTLDLSEGDADNDRWDLVYYDTGDEDVAVREGTAEANPTVPDIEDGEIFLAYVYVEQEATDVGDSDVHNWRSMAQEAGNTRLDDPDDEYDGATVEEALREVIRQAGDDPLNGPLDLSEFDGSAPFDLGENPEVFGAIIDAVVDEDSDEGTEHSYTFDIDGTTLVRLYAESDGDGGVQDLDVRIFTPLLVEDIEDRSTGDLVYDSENEVIPARLRTDMEDEDLTAKDGDVTVFDSSEEWVPRSQVEDRRITTTVSSDHTTDGEEIIFVDTSGGGVTITLSSDENDDGNGIQIVDVGGDAEENPITIDTEGSEDIDGNGSRDIARNYGSLAVRSDGSNWFTEGGTAISVVEPDHFSATESGSVDDGNSGVVFVRGVEPDATLSIYQATLLLASGEPAPTDLDLVIATLDNSGGASKQEDIIVGDGDVQDNEQGEPLASYENTGSEDETVAILVDNGNFNDGTGSSEDIVATVRGEVN